jgi:hypothetical protein
MASASPLSKSCSVDLNSLHPSDPFSHIVPLFYSLFSSFRIFEILERPSNDFVSSRCPSTAADCWQRSSLLILRSWYVSNMLLHPVFRCTSARSLREDHFPGAPRTSGCHFYPSCRPDMFILMALILFVVCTSDGFLAFESSFGV